MSFYYLLLLSPVLSMLFTCLHHHSVSSDQPVQIWFETNFSLLFGSKKSISKLINWCNHHKETHTYPIISLETLSPAHTHINTIYGFIFSTCISLSYSSTQNQRCWQMLLLACDVCAKGSLVSPWYRGPWQPPSTRLWHRILAAPQTAGASAVQQLAWPCWERSSRRERGVRSTQ